MFFYNGMASDLNLVAGGSGLIGSAIVSKLVNLGCDVRSTFNTRPPAVVNAGVEYVKADLLSPDECRSCMKGIKTAYLCAGESGGIAFTNSAVDAIAKTLSINANLLAAAQKEHVSRVVFISSSTMYPESSEPFCEEDSDMRVPPSCYEIVGEMNKYLELFARQISARSSVDITVIRPGSIYGPNDKFKSDIANVIPALIMKALVAEKELFIAGDGYQKRDFIYSDDIAEISINLSKITKGFNVVNVGTGSAITIRELALQILMAVEKPHLEIVFDEFLMPPNPSVRTLNIDRLKSILPTQNFTSIQKGLSLVVSWFLTNDSRVK
jgi:GDP-L-fucose synthase